MPELIDIHHSPGRTSETPLKWQDDAACVDADPELFFPDPGETQKAVEASEWCEICPVAKQCLAYALDNNIEHGIFGGVSPTGRTQLARERADKTHITRQQVVSMTARHMSTREISDRLGISMRQVTRLRSKKAS